MATLNIRHLSPMIPSFNLDETQRFLEEVLGFKCSMNTETYRILSYDGFTLHLQQAGDISEMAVYMEVRDLDTLWEVVKNKLDKVQYREPFLQEYGMKEIHIVLPETKTLLFIGEPVQ